MREKRSAVAGRIVDLRREIDKLQADLYHIYAVLRLYGLEPAEIPTKGRMPKRSAYFGRFEISRRCREAFRDQETITADDVSVRAMMDKGLDPAIERKMRAGFIKRILVTLHAMAKTGAVIKLGQGKGVRWDLVEKEPRLV